MEIQPIQNSYGAAIQQPLTPPAHGIDRGPSYLWGAGLDFAARKATAFAESGARSAMAWMGRTRESFDQFLRRFPSVAAGARDAIAVGHAIDAEFSRFIRAVTPLGAEAAAHRNVVVRDSVMSHLSGNVTRTAAPSFQANSSCGVNIAIDKAHPARRLALRHAQALQDAIEDLARSSDRYTAYVVNTVLSADHIFHVIPASQSDRSLKAVGERLVFTVPMMGDFDPKTAPSRAAALKLVLLEEFFKAGDWLVARHLSVPDGAPLQPCLTDRECQKLDRALQKCKKSLISARPKTINPKDATVWFQAPISYCLEGQPSFRDAHRAQLWTGNWACAMRITPSEAIASALDSRFANDAQESVGLRNARARLLLSGTGHPGCARWEHLLLTHAKQGPGPDLQQLRECAGRGKSKEAREAGRSHQRGPHEPG